MNGKKLLVMNKKEIPSLIFEQFSNIVQTAVDMLKNGASEDAIKDYLNDSFTQLNLFTEKFGITFADAAKTLGIAIDRYGVDSFDVLDDYSETILSTIMGMPLDELEDFANQLILLAGMKILLMKLLDSNSLLIQPQIKIEKILQT